MPSCHAYEQCTLLLILVAEVRSLTRGNVKYGYSLGTDLVNSSGSIYVYGLAL